MEKTKTNKENSNVFMNWFNTQANNFEKSRFGWMTIYITFQSCLGSAAAAFILQNNASVWMLGSCAALSMASNAAFIAQGDKKLCMAIFYLSIITNSIFIIINI